MLLSMQITTKLCLLMPWSICVHGLEGGVIVLLVLIVLMISSPNKLASTLVRHIDAVHAAAESEFCLAILYAMR